MRSHLHLFEEAEAGTAGVLGVKLLPFEFESLLGLGLRLQDSLQSEAEGGSLENHVADPEADLLVESPEGRL